MSAEASGGSAAGGVVEMRMTTKHDISRSEALEFTQRWNDSDHKVVDAFLAGNPDVLACKDEVEHQRAEIDPAVEAIPTRTVRLDRVSEAFVTGRDDRGRSTLWIRKGAIAWQIKHWGESLYLTKAAQHGGRDYDYLGTDLG
jgi:hypothetical protein